jgi:hypothetical protein
MTRDEFHEKAKTKDSSDTGDKKTSSVARVIQMHAPQFAGPRAPAPRPSFAGIMPMAVNIRPLSTPAPSEQATIKKVSFFSRAEVSKLPDDQE